MIICLCRRISDRDIAREAEAGCRDFAALQERTGLGTACGACVEHARGELAAHCSGCGGCARHEAAAAVH